MNLIQRQRAERAWSESERIVLEQVQRVADDVLAPNASAYDESGEFPWANVEALNELGLNAIFVPDEFGGAKMSYPLYLECVAIVSEACAATGAEAAEGEGVGAHPHIHTRVSADVR